jgi:acyl-[acyl-carrier-protein]-phospholipid O-acyltransferase/long-chain-fatty-acid--[acyl-carrier-protein] ligase
VHTASEEVLEEVLSKLTDATIPNLWKPKRGQFLKVDKLPYLGTGKLDLKRLQEIAQG